MKNTGLCIYHFINADMENTKVRMTLCNVTSPIQLNYLIEKMSVKPIIIMIIYLIIIMMMINDDGVNNTKVRIGIGAKTRYR